MNTENFYTAIALLEEHFSKKLSDAALSIWFEYLSQHISDQGLASAVKFAIAESRFMPTAKELVEFSRQAAEEKRHPAYYSLPQGNDEPSDEEDAENRRRIAELIREIAQRKGMNLKPKPKPDYEAIARDLTKAWEKNNGSQ